MEGFRFWGFGSALLCAASVTLLCLANDASAQTKTIHGGTGANNAGTANSIFMCRGGSPPTCTEEPIPDCDDTAGQHLNFDLAAASGSKFSCGTSGTGHTIAEEAVALTDRPTLNFTGTAITCADNAGQNRTDCAVAALANLIDDTTPQLGGALDLADNDITNTTPTFTLTPTELSYVDGATSSLQTQIDGKAAVLNCATHEGGDLVCTGEVLNIVAGAVGLTELGACSGTASGQVVQYTTGGVKTCVESPPGHVIEDENGALTQRTTLNFLGTGITCVDNASKTECTVAQGGHVIRDSGVDETQRGALNFTGNGVTVSDDAVNDETDIAIPGRVIVQDEGTPRSSFPNVNFIGSLISCVDNSGLSRIDCTVSGAAGHTIAYNGANLTDRPTLNFTGTGVSCADDAGNNRTTCTITAGTGGGTGGHTIKNEGVALTARTGLNFTGAGVNCTDDAGNDETDCAIPGGSSVTLQSNNTAAGTVGQLDFKSDFSLDCATDPTECAIQLNSTVYTEGDVTVPANASSLPSAGTWTSSSVIITHGDFESGALEVPYGTASLPTANGGIYYKTNQTPQPMLSVRAGSVNVPLRSCSVGRAVNLSSNAPTFIGALYTGADADDNALIAPQDLTISNLTCKGAEDFASGENATFTFQTATAASCVAASDGVAAGCSFSAATNLNCTITGGAGFSDNSCQPTVSTANVSINENDRYVIEVTTSGVFPTGSGRRFYCSWIECLDAF